ncbi:MAG: 1-acyl-sn-glycerol-3-phosphate acyltransferase, partial [Treponema sp.]|nr:1-acyl-sn-glycerol-3-phosphate acyltransferase [Treponema sp.]
RKFMDALVAENMAEGSRLEGKENFRAFLDAVKNGKHGLILMEHYSNTDLPALCYLLEHDLGEDGKDLSKRIVAIAGMKLNEANPLVRAFAESFTRVVIYPTRSLTKAEEKAKSEEEKIEEEKRARTINLAAMRAMDKCKRDGEVILVFPSGTRYRPGHPETKRGLREIDSYLRMFDVMILVTINGSALTIDMNNPDDMLADLVAPDIQIFTASPVIDCKQFRKDYLATLPESEPDPKQKVIDHIMEIFDEQHDKIEKLR